VYTILNDTQELTSYIDKIIDFPNEKIYEVMASIPDEWNVSTEERDALYHFLLKQKRNLPNIVNNIIKYQSNLE
jgi:hypothetical protein